MTINIEKLRSDMRWESRKFLLQALVATAALLGAGAAIGSAITSWVIHREAPAVSQIVQLPPGTVITIPPAPTHSP